MPYSCFISYRHTKEYKGRAYTERIVEDLKAELELRVTQEVFRDTDRLRGAEFYNEALALNLCRSICMVVLYWPTYFSEDHLFCAREFKAMEALEQQRQQILTDPEERTKGLIIILALRDFHQIPTSIRATRLCKDFEGYTMRANMREDPDFQRDVAEISRYIADRCRAFMNVAAETFVECSRFRLPPEGEVLPWLRHMVQPTLGTAGQGIPR